MKRTGEAFWWSLFAAGGVLAALFVPVLVVMTGLLLPRAAQTTPERYEQIRAAFGFWPVRILLVVVVALGFFHCVHRIRHVLMGLGLHSADRLLAVICYGVASAGTVAMLIVVFRL